MHNDPIWIKVHHEYYYKESPLETLKEGIRQAVHEQGLDFESVMHAAIRGACRYNRVDVLDFVFSHKELDLDERALTEHLSNSFMSRSFSAVEFLLKHDVKLDLDNESVIWVLPHSGLDIIHLIREKGFDIYDPQYNLLYFSFKEYPPKYDIINDMLKSGAKFEDISSQNLYHYFLSYDSKEMTDLIDYVISTGFDINREDCRLIKSAIINNCENILQHLFSIGANTNPQDGSLFQFCAKRDNLNMFNVLQKNGLVLDINDDSIIKTAAEYDSLEVVKFLLEKGFNFDIAYEFGDESVKDWCIEQMHNQLNQDLSTNEPSKRKNKL